MTGAPLQLYRARNVRGLVRLLEDASVSAPTKVDAAIMLGNLLLGGVDIVADGALLPLVELLHHGSDEARGMAARVMQVWYL